MFHNQTRESELIRQLVMMTTTGALILVILLTGVLLFGPNSQSSPTANRDYLSIACQRPAWLIRRAERAFAVEPISPTPVPGQVQIELGANYTRTTPYVEYRLPPVSLPEPYSLRWRIGIGIPEKNPLYFKWPPTRPGWYLNWTTGYEEQQFLAGLFQTTNMNMPNENRLGMEFTPMVRVPRGELRPSPQKLMRLAAKYPGRTWLIGNEPDVEWQDNATPEQYAYAFHCAHAAIKGGDPTAQIAIAGLSQITPLRIDYLDRIWRYYRAAFGREMPVDIWNMHAFVLREEAESWGVRIPPGLDGVAFGERWEIEQHADLNLVSEQVFRMRRWMKENGQQEKPLWITEYGILLPSEYGFPIQDVVTFMWGSFDLFRSLREPELGFPHDDYRLIQRWVWFSSRYELYPTGDLFNLNDSAGPLMRAMSAYIEQHETVNQ